MYWSSRSTTCCGRNVASESGSAELSRRAPRHSVPTLLSRIRSVGLPVGGPLRCLSFCACGWAPAAMHNANEDHVSRLRRIIPTLVSKPVRQRCWASRGLELRRHRRCWWSRTCTRATRTLRPWRRAPSGCGAGGCGARFAVAWPERVSCMQPLREDRAQGLQSVAPRSGRLLGRCQIAERRWAAVSGFYFCVGSQAGLQEALDYELCMHRSNKERCGNAFVDLVDEVSALLVSGRLLSPWLRAGGAPGAGVCAGRSLATVGTPGVCCLRREPRLVSAASVPGQPFGPRGNPTICHHCHR